MMTDGSPASLAGASLPASLAPLSPASLVPPPRSPRFVISAHATIGDASAIATNALVDEPIADDATRLLHVRRAARVHREHRAETVHRRVARELHHRRAFVRDVPRRDG